MESKSFLQEKAYNYIKDHILNKGFERDVLYSETKLAQEIGISRTPMREALQCLSQDGYINILPSRGFTIRQLNEKDMKETIQIRCAIEGFCTQLICADAKHNLHQSTNQLQKLKETLQQMKESMELGQDYQEFIKYDHKFHLYLVNYADNQEFSKIYQKLMYQIQLTSESALMVSGRANSTLAEHEKLYEYLKNGDSAYAYKTLINHLSMPVKMKLI